MYDSNFIKKRYPNASEADSDCRENPFSHKLNCSYKNIGVSIPFEIQVGSDTIAIFFGPLKSSSIRSNWTECRR